MVSDFPLLSAFCALFAHVNTGHMPTERERVLGGLLGGAIGDALGAPIEFDQLADIRARHGAEGVTRFLSAYGTVGAITDDTQMSLFTAEGLLRAQAERDQGGKADDVASIRRAYLRWLRTQDGSVRSFEPISPSSATNLSSGFSFFQHLSDRLWEKHRPRTAEDGGWLLDQRVLHHQRAPGRTCLSALYEGGRGTPDEPLNNSKGCGGVMRVAADRRIARSLVRDRCRRSRADSRSSERLPAGGCARPRRRRARAGRDVARRHHGRPCQARTMARPRGDHPRHRRSRRAGHERPYRRRTSREPRRRMGW